MYSSDMCATKPSAFIDRYCSRLSLPAELTHLCNFIAMKIESRGWISDNTPHAVAAGIVFFVGHICHFALTKTDVKAVCGVSEVTINKCFKKMVNMKTDLVPKCILEKYV
jgi:transcription initiation factor TFIIIB Brf1 subunit/transcription initiation factor TFIIB